MALSSITTKIARISNTLGDWYSNPLIKLVVDIVIYAPATLVSIYATTDAFSWVDKNYSINKAQLGWKLLLAFLTSLSLIYLFKDLIPAIYRKANSPRSQLTLWGAMALMETLSSIVRVKADRFGDTLQNLLRNRNAVTPEVVFQKITMPEQQISYIVHALHAFLQQIDKDSEFDIRLIELQDGCPQNWYAYAPERNSPKTDLSKLSDQHSTLSNCIRDKSMIVIPDIRKESKKAVRRRYVMFDTEEAGSVICYPIYHKGSKTYPFVLSIRCNKPNAFVTKKKEFYKWLLCEFAHRIQLEYSLTRLKEISDEKQQ